MKYVQAKEGTNGFNYVYRLTFLDKDKQEIGKFDKADFRLSGQEYCLLEDDELIGVYGVKNKEKWFTSFGFLYKTRGD